MRQKIKVATVFIYVGHQWLFSGPSIKSAWCLQLTMLEGNNFFVYQLEIASVLIRYFVYFFACWDPSRCRFEQALYVLPHPLWSVLCQRTLFSLSSPSTLTLTIFPALSIMFLEHWRKDFDADISFMTALSKFSHFYLIV